MRSEICMGTATWIGNGYRVDENQWRGVDVAELAGGCPQQRIAPLVISTHVCSRPAHTRATGPPTGTAPTDAGTSVSPMYSVFP